VAQNSKSNTDKTIGESPPRSECIRRWVIAVMAKLNARGVRVYILFPERSTRKNKRCRK